MYYAYVWNKVEQCLPTKIFYVSRTKMKHRNYNTKCVFYSITTIFLLALVKTWISQTTNVTRTGDGVRGRVESASRTTPVPAAWDLRGNPVQCYITSKQKGRLGNQLFQYAALYAVTRQFKECTPFLSPDFVNLTSTFDLSIPVMDITYEVEKRIWELEKNVPATLSRLAVDNIPRHKNVTIKGFYLSYLYIDEYRDQFRKELKFKEEVNSRSTKFLSQNTPKSFTGHDFVRIGIHVRMTDRDTAFMTRLGYIRPPLEYYEQAIAYFTRRHRRVIFVVASDDIEWCRTHLKADHIIFSRENFSVDLAVLSSCDHMITSVGTFGWWAGWLCKGTTLYYAKFPPPDTKAGAIHVPKNWYPPDDTYNHWVPIE